METVRVNIFGTEYQLRTDQEPSHLLRVAGLVDRKMQEVHAAHPGLSSYKVAVLACLYMVDEFLSEERRRERFVEGKVDELLKKLELN